MFFYRRKQQFNNEILVEVNSVSEKENSTNQYNIIDYDGAIITYSNPLTPRELPPHKDSHSASVYANCYSIMY